MLFAKFYNKLKFPLCGDLFFIELTSTNLFAQIAQAQAYKELARDAYYEGAYVHMAYFRVFSGSNEVDAVAISDYIELATNPPIPKPSPFDNL